MCFQLKSFAKSFPQVAKKTKQNIHIIVCRSSNQASTTSVANKLKQEATRTKEVGVVLRLALIHSWVFHPFSVGAKLAVIMIGARWCRNFVCNSGRGHIELPKRRKMVPPRWRCVDLISHGQRSQTNWGIDHTRMSIFFPFGNMPR